MFIQDMHEAINQVDYVIMAIFVIIYSGRRGRKRFQQKILILLHNPTHKIAGTIQPISKYSSYLMNNKQF